MKARVAVLLLLLGGALAWLHFERGRSEVKIAEQTFLDMLVANARDILIKQMPDESRDVVLVEFREEDKAEYASWPPAPLDYIMVLKRLAERQPEVLGIAEPLRWAAPDTQFITELRESMLPFPSVVLGFDLASTPGEMTAEMTEFDAQEMPVLAGSDGDLGKAAVFTRVTRLPEKALRIACQLGFLKLEGSPANEPEDRVLFAATDGKRLVPSFAAQVMSLYRRAPYASQRLRFGTGARLSLGDEHVIPLNSHGSMELEGKPTVPVINALDLMTADLDDETGREARAVLGKGKAVVLTLVSKEERPALGMQQAQAVAQALAMPELRRADVLVDWLVAGAAVLFALWQLRYRRFAALIFGFAVFVSGLAVSLLVFQSSLAWWSPLPALTVLATGTLFCFLWPARSPPAPPPVEAAPEPAT